MRGPIFYFNHFNFRDRSKRTRCDIVISNERVAVSFLMRRVLDFHNQFSIRSSTSNAIKTIGLAPSDLGKEVVIQDTRKEVFSRGFSITEPRERINGNSKGFDYNCRHDQKQWNLSNEKK